MQNNRIGQQEAYALNEAWKAIKRSADKNNGSRDVLYEINQTIAELEIYLEANPDDDIAQGQYEQFLTKRDDFTLLFTEAFNKLSQTEMQA